VRPADQKSPNPSFLRSDSLWVVAEKESPRKSDEFSAVLADNTKHLPRAHHRDFHYVLSEIVAVSYQCNSHCVLSGLRFAGQCSNGGNYSFIPSQFKIGLRVAVFLNYFLTILVLSTLLL
jgi:hypothetical protein